MVDVSPKPVNDTVSMRAAMDNHILNKYFSNLRLD